MLAFSSQWPLKPGKVYSRGTRKFKYTIDIILQDKKKTVKRELCFGATSVHCIEKRFSGVVLLPLSQLKFTEISLDCPYCVEKNNTFTQIQHAVVIIFSSIILKTKRVKLIV